MKLQISLCVIFMSLLFISCGINAGKDVGQKKHEEISVLRYDKLLGEYVRSNSFSAMQKLTMDYRQQTKLLIEDVLAIGTVEDDTIFQRLKSFYSDTTLLRLLSDVEAKFPKLDLIEEELTKGFQNLKKEVPDIHFPLVYSQVSAFNESIVVVDTLLGISLDKYMGEDYPLYKRFYYEYQRSSMRPERIVPDCLSFYLMSRYSMNFHEGTCLLDFMMHSGKINYVVQQILGYDNVGVAIGFSEKEYQWCEEHEEKIWSEMLSKGHIYARDPMIMRYYMKPAPSVEMFGESAPALLGSWIGARIIAAYMKKHKHFGLKDLLEMTDYHKMFEESGYMAF